ncbi:unnamed protein product, partial [Bubo scandiacus]
KPQTLLELEVTGTNLSLCPLHFRRESEKESNIVTPVVKITPGEKNPSKCMMGLRTTRQTQSAEG